MNEANNVRQPTSVETECAKGHSDQRLVRPPWDKLCSCVRVNCHVSTQRPRETDECYKLRWEQTVRSAYEDGAEWHYDADCSKCNSGEVA